MVRDDIAADFHKRTQEILDLRNRAHRLTLEAEERFEQALGPLKVKDWGETGFDVRASTLFAGRRRLEATPHNPGVAAIRRYLAKQGKGAVSLADADIMMFGCLGVSNVSLPEDRAWFLG